MKYDFKAARAQIQFLTQLYRVGKRLCPEDGQWGEKIITQINELEKEIAAAHATINGKMATARNSDHPIIQLENFNVPIIPEWSGTINGEMKL